MLWKRVIGSFSFVLCVQHVVVGDECDVAHLVCFIGAALCKAGLSEEIEMLVLVSEQIAALDKRF